MQLSSVSSPASKPLPLDPTVPAAFTFAPPAPLLLSCALVLSTAAQNGLPPHCASSEHTCLARSITSRGPAAAATTGHTPAAPAPAPALLPTPAPALPRTLPKSSTVLLLGLDLGLLLLLLLASPCSPALTFLLTTPSKASASRAYAADTCAHNAGACAGMRGQAFVTTAASTSSAAALLEASYAWRASSTSGMSLVMCGGQGKQARVHEGRRGRRGK